MDQVGKWAFVAGVVLAVLAGFVQGTWIPAVLAVLGLVVGILNVTAAETRSFLLAAIGLMLSASSLQALPWVGDWLATVLGNLVVFIGPALLVVALKSLFETAKD